MPENWEINWKDYYKILQVHPGAEQEVIKAAFDKLAKKYHPDLNKNPAAENRMKDINEAFEVLGNLEKRRLYHPTYVLNKQVNQTGNQETKELPKPFIAPPSLQFSQVKPGDVLKGTFTIFNTGGPFQTIKISNPNPWLKITLAKFDY